MKKTSKKDLEKRLLLKSETLRHLELDQVKGGFQGQCDGQGGPTCDVVNSST